MSHSIFRFLSIAPDSAKIAVKRKWKRDTCRNGAWLRKFHSFIDAGMDDVIKKTNAPREKNPLWDSWKQEKAMEWLLQKFHFTFDRMLIIQNPYGNVPLCSMLVFETDEKCRVQYNVRGKTAEKSISYCTKSFTRQHMIPVLGLYAAEQNIVEVTLFSAKMKPVAKRNLTIVTRPLPEKLQNVICPCEKMKNRNDELILVTGGLRGYTYAFDSDGMIRWYLASLPRQYGIYLYEGGHFMFPDRKLNSPTYINPHSNVMYEMDFSGCVHEVFHVSGGIHHCLTPRPEAGSGQNREILAAASSLRSRLEDAILCYDTANGKIVEKWDLGPLFPQKYLKRKDWAHLNAIYCCDRDHVLISLRNLHTIAKLNLSANEVLWVAAPPDLYEGTELEHKMLAPDGDGFHYFFQQHAVEILHMDRQEETMSILLFDNHCITKRKSRYYDGRQESYGCLYQIDEKEKKIRTVFAIPCELSPTRSNVYFDRRQNSLFTMAGSANSSDLHDHACISEWNAETGELLSKYFITEGFFRAVPIRLTEYITDKKRSRPLDVHKGKLTPPVRSEHEETIEWKQRTSQKFQISVTDDLILVQAKDHKIDKVFLAGQNMVWEKDFTYTYQAGEKFAYMVYAVSVPVDGLPAGRYDIRLQYEGEYIATGKWFIC